MFTFAQEIFAIIAAFLGLVLKSEDAGGNGIEKKTRAVEELFAVLESPEGLNWPSFLKTAPVSTKKSLLGMLCEIALYFAKKLGLENKSNA